ncbi:hypothetical protein [Streptomyces sp. NPDC000851]
MAPTAVATAGAAVPLHAAPDVRGNVLGALTVATNPDLLWERTTGKIDAAMLPEFVCSQLAGLPGGAAALPLAADGVGALPV